MKENKPKNEIPTHRIVIINLILNTKAYIQNEFINSNKFYITASALLFLKFLLKIKDPRSRLIPNNLSIPKEFITKNYLINADLKAAKGYDNFQDFKGNNNFKIKHIPYFDFFHKLINYFKTKKQSETKEVKIEDLMDIKLAGISRISKEGRYVIERLINTKPKFYFKFNNIRYHDTPEVYGWLFFKPRVRFSYKMNNLNIFLVKNGYAELDTIKEDIYDENIYFYYSDLVEADKIARTKGYGIWQDIKSHNVTESAANQGSYINLLNRIRKRANMRTWEKAILSKKH